MYKYKQHGDWLDTFNVVVTNGLVSSVPVLVYSMYNEH